MKAVIGKRGRWMVLAVVVGALLVVWWRRGRGEGDRPITPGAAPPGAPVAAPAPRLPRRGPGPLRDSTQAPAVTEEARAPIVDEVVLEKRELCEGEENLVTIRAHTPDNRDDAFLHYLVGGASGNPVVVRARADRGGREPTKILVFGRNGAVTAVAMPAAVVKDCRAPYQLSLAFRMLPNRVSAFELSARVTALGASAPFEAVRYLWSFGDGTTSETSEPVEGHDFSRRPQREMTSTFLITCVAVARSGQKVQGRLGLALNNLAFESFAYKGVVKILVAPEPLFPVLGPGGVVRQRFRLWHGYDRPIRIERLRRTRQTMGVAARPAETVPASALGVRTIAPGEVAESKSLELDTSAEPDVYSVEYLIEGTTEDGWPATGNLALMRPPQPPSRENGAPVVTDPLLKAKIVRAREVLGQATVTDEDIWRLDRQGAFANLAVEPPETGATGAPAPPEPPRPPAPASGR